MRGTKRKAAAATADFPEGALQDGPRLVPSRESVKLDRLVHDFTVESIYEAWLFADPYTKPVPSFDMFSACLRLADAETILDLIGRLAAKRQLKNYSSGTTFLHLVKLAAYLEEKLAAPNHAESAPADGRKAA